MRAPIIAILLSGTLSPLAHALDLPTWSYDGINDGQDSWAQLSSQYAACEVGTEQSPVVISYTVPADLPHLNFQYHQGKAAISKNEAGLIIEPAAGSELLIDNTSYALKRIALHSPSEHVVLDQYYLLEIQFQHENKDGRALYLSVFGYAGDENNALVSLLQQLPLNQYSKQHSDFDPATLLPQSFGYYTYSGSLTAPPCTEGVDWRVLKTPLIMSETQLDTLIQSTGRNARLEQPIYTRTIRETRY